MTRPTRNTMACFDCGYALDGLAGTVCPECGRAFDPHDAETFKRILPGPVMVARFELAQAYAACTMLERHGIPAIVQRVEDGIIGQSHMPKGALWVDRIDQQQAHEKLRSSVDKAEHSGELWKCPQCTERLESQFECCWNCGAERPAT